MPEWSQRAITIYQQQVRATTSQYTAVTHWKTEAAIKDIIIKQFSKSKNPRTKLLKSETIPTAVRSLQNIRFPNLREKSTNKRVQIEIWAFTCKY